MYPTVAMQCPAHDVLAVIFPVGGVAEGDGFGPQQKY
jgi:hypothetical protein